MTTATHTPTELLARSVALYDRYESQREVSHYYGLLAIHALVLTAEAAADAALLARCCAILSRFPQAVEHRRYNVVSYRIGGIPRAYCCWRGHLADPASRGAVEAHAEGLLVAGRSDDGLICNPWRQAEQLVWIDVAMAVVPYLLYAGLACGDERYLDEAVRQAELHHDTFLDPATGLLHQCRGFVGPGRFSQDHWSRGQGWGFIALTELVQHLPPSHPGYAGIVRRFRELATALLPHQDAQGFWHQEVTREDAWIESSGTGLIAYGYGVGLRLGLLDEARFRPAFDRGVAGLLRVAVAPDGSLLHCCQGCLCPGEGERRGTIAAYIEDKAPVVDDPHAFGPLMLALVEAARAGIG